jgi:ATP-binding cassette subfamily F protein 3
MPLLTASDLSVSFAELEIFRGISLEINDHARIGIVGPNGQGKTTLLKMLVGELQPSTGSVKGKRGLNIGYVAQTTNDMNAATLRDEVMKAFANVIRIEADVASSATAIGNSSEANQKDADRRYSDLLEAYEAAGGHDYQNRMERVVGGVGLTMATLDTPVSGASGGQRTRASLAKALLAEPDLLVLDEPTNYLDFDGLSWLEGFLGRTSHAFVVVSHDRYFLDKVTTEIWEVNQGKLVTYKGNYSKYRHLKGEQERRQQTEYVRQQQFIKKQEDFIERNRAGRRTREALGREKRLNRMERIESVSTDKSITLGTAQASRTGRIVLTTQDLEVGFHDDSGSVKLLTVQDLAVERLSRTAIIGPNGIGKTTFLHTILGTIPPLGGTVTLGHNVKVGFQRQGTYDLPENRSVLDAVIDIKNLSPGEARTYLGRFLFEGDDVFKPVSVLSGGERTRLAFARLILEEPNVLVLDEPTTHLDIASREALEQVLLQYDGAILFVSHDRALISLLADQLLVVENGRMDVFNGKFEDWAKTREESALRVIVQPKKKGKSKGSQPQQAKKTTTSSPGMDYETMIADLEAQLTKIETRLERATQRQELDKIANLGEEYNRVQAEMEQAWEQWGH